LHEYGKNLRPAYKHDFCETTKLLLMLDNILNFDRPLPVTNVAGSVFVHGAAGAAANAVDVLVAFRRVLGKVDACKSTTFVSEWILSNISYMTHVKLYIGRGALVFLKIV
jgi:hypothetical protein